MEQSGVDVGGESFVYTVGDNFNGVRLDHYLVQVIDTTSRSQIITSIKAGSVTVNGGAVKAGYRLKAGDEVAGFIEEQAFTKPPEPQKVDFEVIYEDQFLLAIDKPPGLVVHPGSGNRDNTLVNGLLHRYNDLSGVGDESRPGIVHRLDKDTSGVMLIARTRAVHRQLVCAFKDRLVEKRYLALIHGTPPNITGRIVAPIGRHPVHRQKMAVRQSGGRYAASSWKILEVMGRFSLLEVHIETGRTHQIRVHMAHAGHPIAGDRLYGPGRCNDSFPRQMLHAWKLRISHPVTGVDLQLEARFPEDFLTVIDSLKNISC